MMCFVRCALSFVKRRSNSKGLAWNGSDVSMNGDSDDGESNYGCFDGNAS